MGTSGAELLRQIKSRIGEVDPAQAREQASNGAVLVDVRETDEFAAGHIPGAKHVPRGYLESRIEGAVPDRSKHLILYCASGNRSAYAARTLVEDLGYEHVESMRGGITLWKDRGYEVEVPRTLTAEQRERYSRHLLLPEVGIEGQQKLLDAKILLLGAGEMAELTAEHLAQHEVQHIFVANRAIERAQELARRFRGIAMQYDAVPSYLEQCDIVIASTAAPHFVVERADIERVRAARRMRNLFLIDLSVPRNIDPTIAEVDGAFLYNIDDLQHVADANRELRMQRAQEAEEIVAREVDAFRKRLIAQDAVPTIVELHDRLEAIRAAELEKCLRKLGPVTAEQRAAVEMLSTQMINKILHYPILQLKESADEPERETLRRTIRKIFGLR